MNMMRMIMSICLITITMMMVMGEAGIAIAQPQPQPQLGLSLKMKPILKLPNFSNLTVVQIHQNLSHISKVRALYLQRLPNNIRSPIKGPFGWLYYMEVEIGTPPLKLNLAMDTASSPTWVQSAHCRKCFQVSSPNFDPKKSTTFQPMPHDNPMCFPPWLTPSGRFCSYGVDYSEHSTKGRFGFDTFNFLSGHHHQQAIPNVAFGCGIYNDLIDLGGKGSPMAGILGLGRDHPSSIVHQLRATTLQKFSYCLPQNLRDQALLHFGNDAELKGPKVQTTPILDGPDKFYYLDLKGISLNGTLLPIDPKLLKYSGGGVVIDSGSFYSHFVQKAYSTLRQAMVSYFLGEYGLQPLKKSKSGFDLCFYIPKNGDFFYEAPSMVFHFQGANFKLNGDAILLAFQEVDELCMMITPVEVIGVPNIFGAFQQRNYRFSFDVAASTLSFVPENC